ncbi:MAG: DNA polymerase III subunit beta [Anaerolineae bacterium]|nr:DNA polymerase III subunit beta [Anaerolineae bacterium]
MQTTLVLTQPNLDEALARARRFVATRTALRALACVHLKAEDGRLQVEATNLEIGVRLAVPARVEHPGVALCAPTIALADLVKTLPPDQVTLRLDAETATATLLCGDTSATLKGVNADEFPVIAPAAEGDFLFQTPPGDLKAAARLVTFAASADQSRPALAGVFVFVDGAALTLVAADGFRLAVRALAHTGAGAERREFLIPARALDEVVRVFSEGENDVRCTLLADGKQAAFTDGEVDVVAQLLDHAYPGYAAIIPETTATRVVIARADLLQACRRADVFARDSLFTVRLHIQPGASELVPGTVTVRASSAETGEEETTLPAAISGADEAVKIAFNGRFLAEALGALDAEQVALGVNEPGKAGVLKPVDKYTDYTYVQMPMAITAML